MKTFALATAAAVTLAVPTLASAETTVIKKVYNNGTRAEMHRDRGMHRGWRPHRHADRVVIIKKRHHHW